MFKSLFQKGKPGCKVNRNARFNEKNGGPSQNIMNGWCGGDLSMELGDVVVAGGVGQGRGLVRKKKKLLVVPYQFVQANMSKGRPTVNVNV